MTFLDSFYAQGIERCLASGAWDPFAGDLPPPSFLDSALLATSCRGLTLFDVILVAIAVLTIAKLAAWLLVETLRLIARYFTLALSGRIKPRQVLSTCMFVPMAVFAGYLGYFSGVEAERYAMFFSAAAAVVALLSVMWVETRERPLTSSRLVLTARPKGALAKASPKSETPTTTDAAPTSIHEDWADIAQQLAEETQNHGLGESREAFCASFAPSGDQSDNEAVNAPAKKGK
ncbi:hypothetical protein [Brucella intermedia]|uniref:hypothetical protein n=1 Tax=Brucella intermedia TaxID=94625 RepID=UPI00244EC8F0|nr:hypothetical protein [Brucella intermedia]WGJ06609.1 hypothetical protein QBQ48_12225 [Brucella intermedia]